MRIEINAGGIGGISVADFQSDIQAYISNADSVISSFKAIQSSTYNLNGGVGSLQGAADDISGRIRLEEEKKEAAIAVQKQSNDFLELAVRVDKQVAADVNQNKDELYRVNPWLRPSASTDDTPWYEDAWNWLCGKGEQFADGLEKAWEWTKDTAKKAWDGLVDFYNEHWYDIINWGVTILCVVGSIVAIALIPVTGGASILLVAGVSALSGAIIAATRSITTQQRDTGTVDWGEVGKEAATAAVVGAITGAIGAGVGGAITSSLSNTGLGASLLSSSSTTVRVLTGAVIGSASEVASGMLTRGAAEATESFLETGSVNFGDVWDAATDPQQMALDAAIGGVSGGVSSAKVTEAATGDTTDWDRTSNSASEERILREMEANGDVEVFDIDPSLSDPIKQNSQLPKHSGSFSDDLNNPNLFSEHQKGVYTYGESSTGGKTATGSLQLVEDPIRNGKAQAAAGGDVRRSNSHKWGADDGGHLIGARFGGETGDVNLTAQNRNLNRGDYKQLENSWAAHLEAGDKVFVHIETDNARRPNAYMGYAIYESPDGIRTYDTFHMVNESRSEIALWEADAAFFE